MLRRRFPKKIVLMISSLSFYVSLSLQSSSSESTRKYKLDSCLAFSIKNLAAFSTFVFSLAETLNHPANPFSLEKASTAASLAAAPDAGWSHLLPRRTHGMGRPSGSNTCKGRGMCIGGSKCVGFYFLFAGYM